MDKNYILQTRLTEDQVALFYLGQVGFLLKYRDVYILVDAYLSDYVDRTARSETGKWVRRYDAPICARDLDFVQYVFCTHEHGDHADPDTLRVLAENNPEAVFLVSEAITDAVERCGVARRNIRGLRCDEPLTLQEGIRVTAIPAAHEQLHPVGPNIYREVGFRFTLGEISLFHAGDCCPYAGLEERLRGCDVLILPINGRDYYRTETENIIGCFHSREAALIAKHCGAALLIPTHWDLYDANGADIASFVQTVRALDPTLRYHIFAPGERYIFAK